MFGSLVVVLPTKHTGGALHLRHDGKSFIHDCSNKFSSSPPQVAWVAFYSDVEHEISKVEQGHRVTLTYNLYFVDGAVAPAIPRDISTSNAFFQAFFEVLADPEFLPEGGTLGFGLRHSYPITEGDEDALETIENRLKGNDLTLFSTAQRLGLNPVLKTVHETEWEGVFLCDSVLEDINYKCDDGIGAELRNIGGVCIEKGEDGPKVELDVRWVTPRSSMTSIRSSFVAYGNEATLGDAYGEVNVIVTVGDRTSRGL
jgi:hypothetical protein